MQNQMTHTTIILRQVAKYNFIHLSRVNANASAGAVQWDFPDYGSNNLSNKGKLGQFFPWDAADSSILPQGGQRGERANQDKTQRSAGYSVASSANLQSVRQISPPSRSSRSLRDSPLKKHEHQWPAAGSGYGAAKEGGTRNQDSRRFRAAEAEAEAAAEMESSPGGESLQGTGSASDLRRLRHLREQAEQKIHALRCRSKQEHDSSSALP
jgi:hypothetical protein